MNRQLEAMLASVLCLVLVAGCSFTTAIAGGSTTVARKHEVVDVLVATVAGGGCALAAIAWGSPDSYAPTQGSAASWSSPADRANTVALGQQWTPISCAVAAVFLASAIYGHNVRPDVGDRGDPSMFADGLGAFAGGFLGAQRSTPTFVPVAPVTFAPPAPMGCTSDYGCGPGFECVRRQYSTVGVCLEAVNRVGTPTFAPPDPTSVRVKTPSASDCRFDSDCTPGFSCDAASGACVR